MSIIGGTYGEDGGRASRFRFAEPATLIGGGPDAGALEEALAAAPRLICADSGAERIGALTPDAVIGDFDSLEDVEGWRARIGDRLVREPDQDTTDFEKCLSLVDAPFMLGVGFLGGRIDHELAALHALVADPRPIALIGAEDVVVAPAASLSLRLEPGDRLSIFPLAPVTALSGAGLRWSIDGLKMKAGVRIGASNEAVAQSGARHAMVSMRFDGPGAVVFAPRARLAAVVNALRAAD